MVESIQQGLLGMAALPPQSLLSEWPDLQAPALKAMDALVARRLVAILHADDPVFLFYSGWFTINS